MKKFTFALILFLSLSIKAQNNPVLYGFDKIPQTLLLNPGAETSYEYHIGIPLMSNVNATVNSTEITLQDLFKNDDIGIFKANNFNEKLQKAINKLDEQDYLYSSVNIESLSGGYKINKKDYLSIGYYSSLDIFTSAPRDAFTLINQGNAAHLNKDFSLAQGEVQAEAIGAFHIGISRRFNRKLTAGARIKLYSGAASFSTLNNSGTFTTRKDKENLYVTTLKDVNININSTALLDENNQFKTTAGKIFGDTFFNGNLGLGLDLGLTYHLTEQIEMTASILDFGYINYASDNRNLSIKGNYKYNGLAFKSEEKTKDSWAILKNDFKKNIKSKYNDKSYTLWRPLKINTSWAYSFGKSKRLNNCHDICFKDFYDNTIGGQLYTVFLPNGPKYALTGFYQRKLSKTFNTKITYTIDDFSYSNIGLGVSANIWRFNIYGTLGNAFNLINLDNENTASAQFGINYIVN